MICPACHHHRPAGHGQPIAPVCAWKPSPDDLVTLRAILPAPASVLRDAVDARIADHQAKTGRKPGKRLRNDFREAALGELLPRASSFESPYVSPFTGGGVPSA